MKHHDTHGCFRITGFSFIKLCCPWIFLFLCTFLENCQSLTSSKNPIISCEPCICTSYTKEYVDVTCVNLPLTSIPRLWDPGTGRFQGQNQSSNNSQQHFYRIRLIGVELMTTLTANSFTGLGSLASLTVSKSRLSFLNESTFSRSAIKDTLSTVDLSYGLLSEVPVEALKHLTQLQWLSLRGNQIESVRGKDLSQLASAGSIKTLLLSENPLISSLEERTFSPLTSLESLEIDFSALERVEGSAVFPPSLLSLSLANGLLRKVPLEALQRLPRLQSLSLRGNLINHLSPLKLAHAGSGPARSIDVIDLSHNLIASLPDDLFAAAPPSVSNLNLVSKLGQSRFGGSRNSITLSAQLVNNSSSPLMLSDAAKTLNNESEVKHTSTNSTLITMQIRSLHLDFNFITALPPTLFASVRIEKLTLSSNRIAELPELIFAPPSPLSSSLAVLDLNYNLLENLTALAPLTALRQLTLKNNRIREIAQPEVVFSGCSATLEHLDLSQNLLEKLPTFKNLKALVKVNLHQNKIKMLKTEDFAGGWCSRLRSFSVSKNSLTSIEVDAFASCPALTELRLGGNRLLMLDARTVDGFATSGLTENQLRLLDFSALGGVSEWIKEDEGDDGSILTFPNVKWLQLDLNSLTRLPARALGRRLPSLRHLDLQNNAILGEFPPEQLCLYLANLTTLILSQNRLSGALKKGAFSGLKALESVALYANQIKKIEDGAFSGLPRLHSLVLSANRIQQIETGAFQFDGKTVDGAVNIMLDQNRLNCLLARSFLLLDEANQTTPNIATLPKINKTTFLRLYLNVSHNQIKTFSPDDCGGQLRTEEDDDESGDEVEVEQTKYSYLANQAEQIKRSLPIRVLDVSHNRLVDQFSDYFLSVFCSSAATLLANHNQLKRLPARLPTLLQTLSLNYNFISVVAPPEPEVEKTFKSSRLHTLSLRYNAIASLSSFGRFFAQLPALKSLDLTGNQIKSIPRELFAKTALVKLVLADNRISFAGDDDDEHQDDCFGVSSSLKILDLSGNRLTSLSRRLLACSALVELLASNNQIASYRTSLPLVRALPLLQRLDLQGQNFDKMKDIQSAHLSLAFLANHSSLSSLNLNNLAIGGGLFGGDGGDNGGDNLHHNQQQAQILAVPFLHQLELAGNGLPAISSRTLSRCRNIRHLNLAANRLQEVPKHIWKYLTRLRYLDLRDNPIDILDSSSFAGLKYLQHLYISGLKLQYIDSRLFLYQSQLSSLKISTYPLMRSFRLQDILARSDALKTIEIEVKEAILSHQIQWAFGGKLRELVITGQSLTTILPDAFQGLDNANDLTLRITNTSIRQLPDGLLKYLADIRYISIDLRRNQLETVSPGVFFGSSYGNKDDDDENDDHVKTWQSRQLLGGIVLEGNPLRCDCNLLWISRWMKALFAEMKSINIEAAILVKASLAHSRCLPNKNLRSLSSSSNDKIPITQLTEEHVNGQNCEQRRIWAGRYGRNSAPGSARPTRLPLTLANISLLISLLTTVLLYCR